MGSTYTDNGGIELIGLGEQAGAWGTTTNNNFKIIDRLINGVVTITLSSGGTSNLSTSDGSLSDGMFKVIVLAGSPDAGHVITIDPESAEKLYFVKNGTSEAIIFNQGSGGTVDNNRAVSVPSGKGAIIFSDGGDSSAVVTDLTALFVNSQAIDGAVIGGTTPAAITGTTITATTSILPDAEGGADIGSTSAEFGDIYIADDKKIKFGSDQDVSIEYDEDGNDTMLITGDVVFADGSTSVDIKSHDLSANGLKLDGTLVTASATELNLLDGVTRTTSQINSARDGTVTSVATGSGLTGGTITSSGTLSLKNSFLAASGIYSNGTTTSFTASTYPHFISGRSAAGGGSFTFTVTEADGSTHSLDMADGDSGTNDAFATILPAGASISGSTFTYLAVALVPG